MNNNVAPDEKLDINIRDISDISGQVAIGKYIIQIQANEKASGGELKELIDDLDQKRQEELNRKILEVYTHSDLPVYPPRLREFVTENRVYEINQALIYLHEHRILFISGIGGIGKTTLARALVETRPANVPLPFWFDFGKRSGATLGDVLEKLAGYMNSPGLAQFREEGGEAGLDDINRLTDELGKRDPIWLIFDNLETALNGDMKFHDIGIDLLFTSLRDSSHQAKVIITSRTLPVLVDGGSLFDVTEDEKKELKGLKTYFAVDYLVKNGLDEVEQSQLEALANGVDGHPLALKLLIGLVEKFGMKVTLKDLSIFKRHKESTIKIARRLFDKLAGDEKELLERMSVFRQSEPIEAIENMSTATTSDNAIENLMDKSLLETDREGNFWLHPLVREFAYDDLKKKIEVHEIAMQYYLSLPLPESRTKKEDVQLLIEAHHHACIAKEYDKALSIIMNNNLDKYLKEWGNNRLLIEIYSEILPIDPFNDKPLLSEKAIHIAIIGLLGMAYFHSGEPKKAIRYIENLLVFIKINEMKDLECEWLGNLGDVYYYLSETEKAIECYKKALNIAQKIENKLIEGIQFGSLGNICRFQGNYKKAIEYYKEALNISQEIGDRRNEGQWTANLGVIYRHLNEPEKNIDCNKKALEIAQEIGNKQQEGEFLGNIGTAYFSIDEVEIGIKYYKKALRIAKETESIHIICVLTANIGNAYLIQHEYKKAIEYYKEALKISQKMGDRHIECQVLGNMGSAYCDISNERKGIECFEKGVKIAQEIKNKQSQMQLRKNLSLAYLNLSLKKS